MKKEFNTTIYLEKIKAKKFPFLFRLFSELLDLIKHPSQDRKSDNSFCKNCLLKSYKIEINKDNFLFQINSKSTIFMTQIRTRARIDTQKFMKNVCITFFRELS